MKTPVQIISGPENGTFYWVAGEKEAKEFTQADIDEGRVLYAQLNMHSYKVARSWYGNNLFRTHSNLS